MQMASAQQSKAYLKARDLLAQNSALLASIDEVPAKPQEFHLSASRGHYQLPINREKQLSEDLAFLASRKKDPTKVVAVAIEEDQDKQGMTIRVAINQGDLSVVKDGLTRITQVMQRASTRIDTREYLQPQMLQDIVTLDFPRILSRLRSKHAPSSGQRALGEPIIHLLKQHIDSGIAALSEAEKPFHEDLQRQCTLLANVFDRFEALKLAQIEAEVGGRIVVEILGRIVQLVDKFDIPAVLRISTNASKKIEPTLLESLPISLGKLARYYKLSSSLIEATRDSKYTVFKNVRVLCLNPNDFAKTSITLKNHPLDEILKRFQTINMNPQAVRKAHSKPWILTGKVTHAWKIHAEIQLLSFYQFQNVANVPRILAASKGSCYLCCQFIRAHARFQVPRTHGKLYTQWTLPDIPNSVNGETFLKTVNQLNKQLETEIRKALIGPVKKTVYPNESVNALNLPWSPASTVAALATVKEDMVMPSILASSSLPDPERPLTADIQSRSHDEDLEISDLRASHNLPRILSTPDMSKGPSKEAIISNRTNLSLSTDDGVCLDITSDWSYYRIVSPSRGVWCHNNGLDLYLSLADGDDPLRHNGAVKDFLVDQKYWVGVKSIEFTSEFQSNELKNVFDVACLDFAEHTYNAGAALSDIPLVLKWLGSTLILQFSIDRPPADPVRVTQT